jgi:hypothetical protein
VQNNSMKFPGKEERIKEHNEGKRVKKIVIKK